MLMTENNDIADIAFDLITCDMPASRRLNVVVIGAAIVAENKRLGWNVRELVKEIMGPLK